MTADGLICTPPRGPIGTLQTVVMACVLLTSAGVVFGTGIVDYFDPIKRPRLVGAEQEKDRERRARATVADGSLARLIEDDYRLTSRVRNTLATPYTRFLFRHLKEVNSSVYLGSDGWLFLRERVQTPPDEPREVVYRAAATFAATTRLLSALNTRHILVPIPRKSVVYESRLPIGIDPQPQFDSLIAPIMRQRGVEALDLLPIFQDWSGLPLYLSMDSHWSHRGIQVTAEAMAEFAGTHEPVEARSTELEISAPSLAPPIGDLLTMAGVDLDESDLQRYSPSNPELIRARALPGRQPIRSTGSDRLALCGTSFSDHSHLAYLLAHFSNEFVADYCIRGGNSFEGVFDALPKRPRLLFQEVPNHAFFSYRMDGSSWSVPTSAARLFAKYTRPHLVQLPMRESILGPTVKLGNALSIEGGQILAQLNPGHVAHSGDGVLELEANLTLLTGNARLVLHSAKSRMSIPLQPGENHFVLPLLAQEPGAHELSLVVEQARDAKLQVNSLRLVTGLDNASSASFQKGPIQIDTAERRWSQTLNFQESTTLDRFGALALGLSSDGSALSEVSIKLGTSDSEVDFDLGNLNTDAVITLSPGPLGGERLQSVRISGSLPAPTLFNIKGGLMKAIR